MSNLKELNKRIAKSAYVGQQLENGGSNVVETLRNAGGKLWVKTYGMSHYSRIYVNSEIISKFITDSFLIEELRFHKAWFNLNTWKFESKKRSVADRLNEIIKVDM